MFDTRNDLAEVTRTREIELATPLLAEAIDLMHQAKQAHWNVKGAEFRSLHALFDEVAEAAEEHADTIAERIVQLAGVAKGTIQAVAARSKLPPYPLDVADGLQHATLLAASVALFGANVRAAIGEATDLGDAVTGDMLLQVSKDLDKRLWMLEAHFQRQKRAKEKRVA